MTFTMTLADTFGRPLRSLRLSVVAGSLKNCTYCMPEASYVWLPKADILTFEEIDRLVDVFLGSGVDKVRLTGGEPLVRRDLPVLVGMLARKPALRELALTTNGVYLGEHAEALHRAGLRRLTVSLDTLRRERFARIAQRDSLAATLAGIDAAVASGFAGIKLDTVLLRGINDDEIIDLLAFSAERGIEVRFIEYMDVGGATRWDAAQVVPRHEILAIIEAAYGTVAALPGRGPAPAERFRLADGTIFGIIASTTAPFCAACDRSRLTADGTWYRCLYATDGTDLRGPLRAGASDEELADLVASGWQARRDRGAEERLRVRQRSALFDREELRRRPHLEMHTRGG